MVRQLNEPMNLNLLIEFRVDSEGRTMLLSPTIYSKHDRDGFREKWVCVTGLRSDSVDTVQFADRNVGRKNAGVDVR